MTPSIVNKKRLASLVKLSIVLIALGSAHTSLQAMQAPRTIFRLARTGLFAAASYFIYDTVRHDGKKTRSVVEKSTQALKELYQEGNTQLKILIGATHDETVKLLKKQHEEAVRRLKKIEHQNKQLLAQNGELKEQLITLVNGQQRIEKTLNPTVEQPVTLLDQIRATIPPSLLPEEIKEKVKTVS